MVEFDCSSPQNTMNNTEHRPWSDNLSPADQAAELFRSRIGGTPTPFSVVPEQYRDRFTPALWERYVRDRADAYMSFAWRVTPEDWLSGERIGYIRWVCTKADNL